MSRLQTVVSFSASLLALAAATAVQAQTAPAAEEASETEIVVTGTRASQVRALAAKREAIGVIDVAAADDIGRLPDRNVAEVIEHLPGIGVTYDQGEGRYVSVRGVPSTLNGYTLNGLEIGNPDGNTRALPLDIVSGQLVNRVEVAKVKTADMDGQGIGGTINLVTETAFDFKEPFALAATAKAGYQELNKKVPYQGDASIAKRFGADEQFGIVLGGSYSKRDFASDGFYPDDWRPLAGAARGGVPTNIKYTEYNLTRTRIGAAGSLDWHPNDHQTLYVRGVYSKFIEDEVRGRYRLDFTSTPFTFNADGLTGTAPGTPSSQTGAAGTGTERRQDLRLDYKVKSIATAMVGGSTEFDRLKFDYAGSRSRNKVLDRFSTWQFRCNPGPVNFDFSDVIYTAAPVTECNANQLQFRQYNLSTQRGVEDIWQGKLDATYDLGGESFIKLGAKYRTSDRDLDQSNPVYDRGTTAATRFTLGQYNLQGGAITVHPDNTDTDKGYVNSPLIDPAAIKAFTDAQLNGNLFVFNRATSLTNDTISDFQLKEKVASGYAMANLAFGAVTVTPGLRFEHTRLNVTGYQLQTSSGVSTAVPLRRASDYNDWLPSLIVRIKPSDETIFRLSYSRSLGRPEYNNLSPGGSIDTGNGTVALGNPDLKPYRADNFDATGEWYFARGGLLSVGVFAKRIANPIFTQTTTLTNTVYNGVNYTTLAIAQPFNADRGDIVGIEAQFQQQFTFLPGALSGLGIQLTGTLTDSTLRLPNGRTSSFPSQSKYLYGAELFYQRGPVEASVAYHNTGYALLAVGALDYQDQSNDDLKRLDAKASVAVLDNVTVFAEAQNLTDAPTRQYQGDRKDWVIQNERYGRTFYGGVSVKF
ncbi:TonB-dependent receptor [Sphingomonas endolithica]|uniref:TonB-dependent receptor n=1 Tax=Sphingomonas endolithica TaxID=2972485 RepID=UPI0021AE5B18|nr:TonB-dependent receptor [Sphingomonas sp. ZFBP2030]